MRQVNVLPIEVNQGVESKGILSNIETQKSANADRSNASNFSDYMADKSARYNGKKRQETARADENQATSHSQTAAQPSQKHDKSTDVNNKVTDEHEQQSNENVQADKSEKSHSETTGSNIPEQDKKVLDEQATKYADASVENTRAEVAIKLLDFINASEVTSTEHSQSHEQSRQAALEMAKQINSQQQQDLAGKKSTVAIELAQKEQKLASEIQAILAGREVKPQSELNQKAQAATGSEQSELNAEQSVEIKKNVANINDKTLQTLASTEQLNRAKSAELGKENVTALPVEDAVAAVDKVTAQNSAQIAVSSNTELDDEVVEVLKKSSTAEPEKPVASTVNNSALHSQNAVEATKPEVSQTDKEKLLAANAVAAEVAVKTDKKESNVRIINQATSNVVNVDADTHAKASADGQSQQQNTEQTFEKPVFETKSALNVEHEKQTIADTKAERHVAFSEPTKPTASLTAEQEQAAQAIHAKASAESVSVQSTRSAQIIAQETIAINRKDFSVAVKEKVMVMINQKLRQLEIRLDPPELGSMQVKINMQNEQAAVNFVVQNPQAKDALEQHMGKLKDMLEQSGVDVGDANIEQRDQKSNDEDQAGSELAHGDNTGENASAQEQMSTSETNLYKASSTGIDYYA